MNDKKGAVTRMNDLKARFNYQFAGPNIGISVSNGWLTVFEGLCSDIDALLGEDKRGFHWVQCKEKYGTARFYYELENAKPGTRIDVISAKGLLSIKTDPKGSEGLDTLKQLDALVEAAEDKIKTLCYVCGEPATLDRSTGWILTLCSRHSEARAADRKAFMDELNEINGAT